MTQEAPEDLLTADEHYGHAAAFTRTEAEAHILWDAIKAYVGPGGSVTVSFTVRNVADVELDCLNDPLDQQGVSDAMFNHMVFDVVDIMAILKHKLDAALVRTQPVE